jgi:hypothetical protein
MLISDIFLSRDEGATSFSIPADLPRADQVIAVFLLPC